MHRNRMYQDNNVERNRYEKEMVETLKRTVAVLDNNEILYWVDCGTLLGLIRDGKIIPWDNDVEIGAWIRDKKKYENHISELQDEGLIITKHTSDKLGLQLPDGAPYKFRIAFYAIKDDKAVRGRLMPQSKVGKLIKNMIEICVESIEMEKDDIKNEDPKIIKKIIMMLMKLLPKLFVRRMEKFFIYFFNKFKFKERYGFEIPYELFESFEQKNFYGMELTVPKRAYDYLRYRYGHDWNIPKKEWIDYASRSPKLRRKSEYS